MHNLRDDGEDRSLLLVDDDPMMSAAVAAALRRRGYGVEICHTIADAKLRLSRSAPPRFALVDLRLPDGPGLVLVQAIRQASAEASIVVLTGFANIATAIEAIKLGASDYLCKPVDVDSVVAALEGRSTVGDTLPEAPVSVPKVEHDHIQRVLTENQCNISATARALGMHRRTLQRKLAKSADAH